MKKLRIVIAIILCLSLILSLSAFAGNDTTRLKNQDKAVKGYNSMLKSFKNDVSLMRANKDYPDYYGGAYCNQNGNLVVLLKENSSDNVKAVRNYSQNDNVLIEDAKYSYNDLYSTINTLNAIYAENTKIDENNSIGVVSFGLYEDQNHIIVYLEECNNKNIKAFREQIIDSDMIQFMQNDNGALEPITSIKCGEEILNPSNGGFSIGYRAKALINGSWAYGFVTAGHGAKRDDPIRYVDNNTNYVDPLGVCRLSQLSGSVDAAFVEITNPSFTLTSTVYRSATTPQIQLYAGSISVLAGTQVYKSGYSTGLTSGFVNTTSFSFLVDGHWISDMVQTTAYSEQGDSGGVFFYADPYNLYYGYICGVSCARDQLGIMTYYIKHSNIASALGVSLY